jgi:hypothetical protein
VRRATFIIWFSFLLHLALGAGVARASQYNVSEVPLLVAEADARKLHQAGLHSTGDVLAKGATARGRAALARRAGLPRATIDALARRADLLRLDDISPNEVLLLEAAGVKSVTALGKWDARQLSRAVGAANDAKKIAPPAPTDARLRAWIAQARSLPVALR